MTKFCCFLLLIVLLASCNTTTYYISRHMERAGTMGNDPQLTPEGEKQAMDLRDYLKGKSIKGIYSTNFNRTRATAKPTSELYQLPVNIYSPGAQANNMIDSLKTNNKNNILVVGHSNTVDDMVNRFLGTNTITDLPETEYGSLFIVKKKGSNYTFEKIKVPQTTPR